MLTQPAHHLEIEMATIVVPPVFPADADDAVKTQVVVILPPHLSPRACTVLDSWRQVCGVPVNAALVLSAAPFVNERLAGARYGFQTCAHTQGSKPMRKYAPVDVSILVVSYNTRELTRIALDTIAAETKLVSYEVIAIDNASSAGTPESSFQPRTAT